jgi:hypothetical protein
MGLGEDTRKGVRCKEIYDVKWLKILRLYVYMQWLRHYATSRKVACSKPDELYYYRRLSVKLVPTFADRGCWVVSAMDPYVRTLCF